MYFYQEINQIQNIELQKQLTMKLLYIPFVFITAVFSFSCRIQCGKKPQENQGLKIEFTDQSADNRIDVMADGKLFTSFCWYDSI